MTSNVGANTTRVLICLRWRTFFEASGIGKSFGCKSKYWVAASIRTRHFQASLQSITPYICGNLLYLERADSILIDIMNMNINS